MYQCADKFGNTKETPFKNANAVIAPVTEPHIQTLIAYANAKDVRMNLIIT